jgi:guanine deaminase
MKKEFLYGLTGAILNPLSCDRIEWIRDGLLVYDDKGIIHYCGKKKKLPGTKYKNISIPGGSIIIPGMIDCHNHLSQFDAIGQTGFTLLDWLKNHIYPAEECLNAKTRADDISRRYFNSLLSNGVTFSVLYTNFKSGVLAAQQQAKKAGIRAIIGYTLMDRSVPTYLKQDISRTIGECRELSDGFKKDPEEKLYFSLNPRFAPACTPKYLEQIGRLAQEENLYIQTHLSENRFEISEVKKAFPNIKTYAGVYDHFGLLTKKTLLAHCIHLSKAERELMQKRNCGVIHCPSSNLFLHSGRFPLEHWKDYPKLALGSDIAAGPSCSMLEVMRDGYYVNIQKLSGLFYLATLGGAKTLGLESTLGNFKKGKQADFVILDCNQSGTASAEAILSKIIFRSSQVGIQKVFISGKQVWSK